MNMPKAFLKQNRKKRLEQGHPWVFPSEIDKIEGDPQGGDIVHIVNHVGHFLAQGFYNPLSQLILRVVSYSEADVVDENLFYHKIVQAWKRRQWLVPEAKSCRVVHGEADFLPGLIIDKYVNFFNFTLNLMFIKHLSKKSHSKRSCGTGQPPKVKMQNTLGFKRRIYYKEFLGDCYGTYHLGGNNVVTVAYFCTNWKNKTNLGCWINFIYMVFYHKFCLYPIRLLSLHSYDATNWWYFHCSFNWECCWRNVVVKLDDKR